MKERTTESSLDHIALNLKTSGRQAANNENEVPLKHQTNEDKTNATNFPENSTTDILHKFVPLVEKPVVKEPRKNLFGRVKHVLTRSHEAVWASLSLTFLCILLVLMVGYSRMWKTYKVSSMPAIFAFSESKSTTVPFAGNFHLLTPCVSFLANQAI